MTRFACLFAVLACGCPTPVCPTLATRCIENRVELCGSDGQWQTIVNCDEVTSGGEWACGTTREDGQEINTCLPTEAP